MLYYGEVRIFPYTVLDIPVILRTFAHLDTNTAAKLFKLPRFVTLIIIYLKSLENVSCENYESLKF
jgi:hypothetical protein